MPEAGDDCPSLPPAVSGRLDDLVDLYGLGGESRWALGALLARLAMDGRAPTTVNQPSAAVDTHVADSLAALELQSVRDARRVADVGSGAGFPGLVLAACLPKAQVSLIESQESKCSYIATLATAMRQANARVICARAEDWREGIAACEIVTARALAAQPVVLEYAAPLLALGGRLVDWRGLRRPEEEQEALRAAALLGLERVELRRVQPFAGAEERHLHVFEKRTATPAGFPRRTGLARKRPLGARPL